MRVYFVLPKGAYATTVLATAFAVDIDESRERWREARRPPMTKLANGREP